MNRVVWVITTPYRQWKARRITKMFMEKFANERIEQIMAENEGGQLYTADEIGRLLGVEPTGAERYLSNRMNDPEYRKAYEETVIKEDD